jgi:hypothetical protein
MWSHSENTSYHRTWDSLILTSATQHKVAESCETTIPFFLWHLHHIGTNQKQNVSASLIPSECTVVFLLITKLSYTGSLSCGLLYRFDRIKFYRHIMRNVILIRADGLERIKHSSGATQDTSVVFHQHIRANHNVHPSTRITISDKLNSMMLNSRNSAARFLDTD